MKIGTEAYRKFKYFYDNEILVHFCLLKGGWKNGLILDLNEDKLTLVLKENKEGVLPFLLEEINPDNIEAYRGEGR